MNSRRILNVNGQDGEAEEKQVIKNNLQISKVKN